MARRPGTRWSSVATLLVTAILAAACSAAPQSLVTESTGPAPAAPSTVTPASATPDDGASPSGAATPAPTGDAATTRPRIPDKPARVTFKTLSEESLAGGGTKVTSRIAWSAPEGVATRFTVVGITTCLRNAKKYDGKPCLVKGMRIPKEVQEVLAVVPGTERSVDIAWERGEPGPGPYYAVLIRASSEAGDSIFTIAWSDTVCWQCTY